MWSTDESLGIVFNGEIYNYRELARTLAAAGLPCRTTSDTEVILNLYRLHGPACVSHLRGMFAFALWDKAKQRLFLARDRVGIKPLYYLRTRETFAFASEIKAIAVTGYSAPARRRRCAGRLPALPGRAPARHDLRRHPQARARALPAGDARRRSARACRTGHRRRDRVAIGAEAPPQIAPLPQRSGLKPSDSSSRRRRRSPRSARRCARACAITWWPTCRSARS